MHSKSTTQQHQNSLQKQLNHIQTKRMSHQLKKSSEVLLLVTLGLAMCALEAAAGGGSGQLAAGCARRQAIANTTRVALITDSESPIGLATAKMLARQGYSLALVGASRPQLEQALKECSEASVGVATEVSCWTEKPCNISTTRWLVTNQLFAPTMLTSRSECLSI